MPGDRQAGDACADDRDVGGGRGPLSNILHGFADIDGAAFGVVKRRLRRQAKRDLAEPPVALDGRVVAVGRPLLAHPAGPAGILEGLVERQHEHVFRLADPGDQLVQAADRLVGVRPAVVPGQDVREHHAEPELLAAPHHLLQVGGGRFDGALDDVVDPALHDEHRRRLRRRPRSAQDLLGELAADAVVPEVDSRIRGAAQYRYWLCGSSPSDSRRTGSGPSRGCRR